MECTVQGKAKKWRKTGQKKRVRKRPTMPNKGGHADDLARQGVCLIQKGGGGKRGQKKNLSKKCDSSCLLRRTGKERGGEGCGTKVSSKSYVGTLL